MAGDCRVGVDAAVALSAVCFLEEEDVWRSVLDRGVGIGQRVDLCLNGVGGRG